MKLCDFRPIEPRPLPVFVLADASGSMQGEKIQSLNLALREMIGALRILGDLHVQVQLSVISFGGSVGVVQPLAPVGRVELPELTAAGKTPLGEALECLVRLIEDPETVPPRAYSPTVVLVSDGHPTDVDPELAARIGCRAATVEDFLTWEPLAAFHASGRVSRCVRLAVGIGGDADQEMLRAFVNTPGLPVLRVQDARGIERFFQMVTMSVAQRSVSRNPDVFSVPNFEPFLDQDLVI